MIFSSPNLRFMMARLVSFFIIILLVCSNAAANEIQRFKVITTFTVIADIARNVAGDAALVESITKPDAEIHNYQATPADIRRAQGADLILYNGLNLELWFDKFFKNLSQLPKTIVTEGITPMGIATGPYTGKPNPHAWMSASNALVYVRNIRNALIYYDPENTESYIRNAELYSQQILEAVEPFDTIIKDLPESRRWLVTSEGAFSYLARDYNLKELYLWPINSDGQGTPQQIRSVIDLINEHDISAIFSESTVSAKPAQQVARETKATYAGVLYVDSLSSPEGKVPTYIDLLTETLSTIAKGINK